MHHRIRPAPLVLTDIHKTNLHQEFRDAARDSTSLYTWIKILGSGSYGVVKEASRNSDGLPVAVKQINHSGDEAIKASAREEYEFLQTFDHESLVKVYAMHEFPSASWICMELCAGGSLISHIDREGALNERRMRHLSQQLVSGLSFLHSKRVVHRDIKPENLLLADTSRMKIADFGSAKRIGNANFCSAMLTHRGSGLYSAPEIMFGKTWNERVDVWACGLCCYFFCQASLPFDVNDSTVRQRLMAGSCIEPGWKHPMSDPVEIFIVQCLIVDPMLRPPMLELAQHKMFTEGTQPLRRRNSEQVNEASTSFDVLNWQERRDGQHLFQRLADRSFAREQERRHPPSPLTSCDMDPLADFSPEIIDVSLVELQEPKLGRQTLRASSKS
eukprot:TRINITY_DN28221_c0_g1_i1.p1 TRINITY_DN28221_c0_g1~~TRINITY_DN28221_c0_g1_i1.p1  ORF type:complete len:387 (+),score=38.88 TRINITY_DN28221_c0_g1_i1:109-1269(+)